MNVHPSNIQQDDYIELPRNLEAEQALLGAILINNDAFGLVETFLDPEHFYEPTHQNIYRAASSLIRADKRADPITLKTFFDGQDVVKGLSIQQYLARLCGAATTIVNAKEYGSAVYDLAVRRETIAVCQEATERAYHANVEDDPGKLIESTVEHLEDVISAKSGRHKVESGWVENLASDFIDGLNNELSPGVPWSLGPLDRMTGGLQPQDLIIIAGRPSMGKSTLASSLARSMAINGTGVLFVSLEMNRASVMARMLSDMLYNRDSPIEYSKMLRRTLNATERERIQQTLADFKDLPLDVVKTSALTTQGLRSLIRQKIKMFERRGLSLDVVMVDYLGLMRATKRYAGDKTNEVGEISGELKAIANDFNMPVVAMSQLSRAVEARDNKRPTLADLRNSGDIEQDADTVMFVYREHYYLDKSLKGVANPDQDKLDLLDKTKSEIEIIIEKQRNGQTGTITARVDMGSAAVREWT